MKLIRFILFGTVFTTGAAVLIIEISAVRMLAPYFGSSLYVLSSVLTVILLALSTGYYFGGKLSDGRPYHVPLYSIIFGAGITLLALTYISNIILPAVADYTPILIGPLLFSIVLFFIPAFLLGIDSPYVIKLLSINANEEERGKLVGSTFFWSTAGSIVGSIVTGFVLIPIFGLKETLIGTSVILILLGSFGLTFLIKLLKKEPQYDSRNNGSFTKNILIGLAIYLILFFLSFSTTKSHDSNTLYETDGLYSHIRIFDGEYAGEPVRYLKRDVNNSSAQSLQNDDLVYSYSQFANFYQYLVEKPTNFLMLGGGAYTIPGHIYDNYPNINIDIVEIEPQLHELAIEYFRFPVSEKITNYVMDARVFIKSTTTKYDLIFVDTFSSGFFIPPHLITQEFFLSLKENLSDDGVIMINFISRMPDTESQTTIGSFTKTLLSIFNEISVYSTNSHNIKMSQNFVYVLRNDGYSATLPENLELTKGGKVLNLTEFYLNPKDLYGIGDTLLTDNNNPAELLLMKEKVLFK